MSDQVSQKIINFTKVTFHEICIRIRKCNIQDLVQLRKIKMLSYIEDKIYLQSNVIVYICANNIVLSNLLQYVLTYQVITTPRL